MAHLCMAVLVAMSVFCSLAAADKPSPTSRDFYTLTLEGTTKAKAPITIKSPVGLVGGAFAIAGHEFGPAKRFEVLAIEKGKFKNQHTGLEVAGITTVKILDHQSKAVHHLFSGTPLIIPSDDH